MSKSYLKQVLTYINKVCHIGKEINNLKDKIIESPVKVSTITFVVLFGFMLQINSFNRLKHWIKRNKFNKIVPKGTQIPCIDAVRRCLSNFDLEGLKDINTNLVKTVIKNKVFRNDNIYNLKVAAIDGVELFESAKKCCNYRQIKQPR